MKQKKALRCNSIRCSTFEDRITSKQQNDYANIREEKHINTQDKVLQIKINHPQVRHSEVVAQIVTQVNSDIEEHKNKKNDYI